MYRIVDVIPKTLGNIYPLATQADLWYNVCGLVVPVGMAQRTVNPSSREFDSHPSLGRVAQLVRASGF